MILMKNMLLKKLISNLPKEKKKIKVLGLSTNSKKVKKGFIFFAVRGNKINGERYITQAIKKGAVAIVCSKNCNYVNNKIVILIKYHYFFSLDYRQLKLNMEIQ